MQLILHGERTDVPVTSVTLARDVADPLEQRIYMFHCIRCGSPVLQHGGNVVRIMPIYEPTELPMIIQCSNSRCKHKYLFRVIL